MTNRSHRSRSRKTTRVLYNNYTGELDLLWSKRCAVLLYSDVCIVREINNVHFLRIFYHRNTLVQKSCLITCVIIVQKG